MEFFLPRPPRGVSHLLPVRRSIRGARETAHLHKRFQKLQPPAVSFPPVFRHPPRQSPQQMTGPVRHANPRQNQKPAVIGDSRQAHPARGPTPTNVTTRAAHCQAAAPTRCTAKSVPEHLAPDKPGTPTGRLHPIMMLAQAGQGVFRPRTRGWPPATATVAGLPAARSTPPPGARRASCLPAGPDPKELDDTPRGSAADATDAVGLI